MIVIMIMRKQERKEGRKFKWRVVWMRCWLFMRWLRAAGASIYFRQGLDLPEEEVSLPNYPVQRLEEALMTSRGKDYNQGVHYHFIQDANDHSSHP